MLWSFIVYTHVAIWIVLAIFSNWYFKDHVSLHKVKVYDESKDKTLKKDFKAVLISGNTVFTTFLIISYIIDSNIILVIGFCITIIYLIDGLFNDIYVKVTE